MKIIIFSIIIISLQLALADLPDRYIIKQTEISKSHGSINKMISVSTKKMRYHDAYVSQLSTDQVRSLKKLGYDIEKDIVLSVYGKKSKKYSYGALDGNQEVPWGIDAIDARKAQQEKNGSGEGSVICVIDTGVANDHLDIADKVIGGEAIVKSITPDKPEWYDDMGHGTHVSGTIVSSGALLGVAPMAKVYAIKVLDADGSGYSSDVADGIKACIGKGKIINMSLGSSQPSEIIENAMKEAKASGIISACAAGNDGGKVGYPAAYKECVAVSAIGSDLKLASFSSRGKEIKYAAPGVDVKSTVPGGGYESWDGTSMATPHVAGVMAVKISAKKKSLKSVKLNLKSEEQGKGLINSLRTVTGK